VRSAAYQFLLLTGLSQQKDYTLHAVAGKILYKESLLEKNVEGEFLFKLILV